MSISRYNLAHAYFFLHSLLILIRNEQSIRKQTKIRNLEEAYNAD